jgi:hypothetical protein
MKMKTKICLSLVAAGLLSACGPSEDAIAFDGQLYRTKVRDLDQRHTFTVTAKPVSSSLLGAKEAARYEATIYCVNNYGSSKIDWLVGPDDPDEAMSIENDTLTLQGECPQ